MIASKSKLKAITKRRFRKLINFAEEHQLQLMRRKHLVTLETPYTDFRRFFIK